MVADVDAGHVGCHVPFRLRRHRIIDVLAVQDEILEAHVRDAPRLIIARDDQIGGRLPRIA